LSEPKHQLVTLLSEFDVKARFLTSEELAEISTFPRDYFSQDGLKLSHKDAIKLIGNAVPPEWFYKILSNNVEPILEYKQKRKSA
jgi:DNA (cytosine-5)-methyltransferase 1